MDKAEVIRIPPKTFDEAVQKLHDCIEDTAAILAGKSAEDMVTLAHNGLGRQVRNDWSLWKDGELRADMERLGFTHPDDMSSAILLRFVCEVRGETYDLAADVKRYQDYWAAMKDVKPGDPLPRLSS